MKGAQALFPFFTKKNRVFKNNEKCAKCSQKALIYLKVKSNIIA